MKQEYLHDIRERLEDRNFEQDDIKDIIGDYSQLYDDMIANGLSEEEAKAKLGTPEAIVAELMSERTVSVRKKPMKGRKIIPIMPFVSTIIFFILGFVWQLWNVAWMAFLLIPVTAILVEGFNKRFRGYVLTPLMPFVALVVYMGLGFGFRLWHPGWLVFLLIPVMAILETRKLDLFPRLTALSPFVALIAFFVLGEFGLWHPGWLVFLMIPMIAILNGKNLIKVVLFELSFAVAIGLYLGIGYGLGAWDYAALSFLIPLIYGVFSGEIKVHMFFDDWFSRITVLLTVAVYVTMGVLFPVTWEWLWVIFLVNPVQEIVRKGGKENMLVAVTPFVSIAIFYLVGYFVPGAFAYSWMAFFLIPIVAIIKGK